MTAAGARHARLLALAAATLLALPFAAGDASAFDDARLIDWQYAPTFGSGVYRVADKRAALITVPVRFRIAEIGERDWPLSVFMPITLGLYDVAEDPLDVFEPLDLIDKVGMASILPGLSLDVPVAGTRLRPFANVGAGVEFDRGDWTAIWALGVTALHRRAVAGLDLGLGAELTHSAFASQGGASSRFTRFGLGLDLVASTGLHVASRELLVGGYGLYRIYFNDIDVFVNRRRARQVAYEAEVALTLGLDPAPKILGLEIERLGIAYRFGSHLEGVRLVTVFPF